jgi:hypothetical protein
MSYNQRLTDTNSSDDSLLKCIHINGQSIRNKMDLLTAETLGYDVIAISEFWLGENDM